MPLKLVKILQGSNNRSDTFKRQRKEDQILSKGKESWEEGREGKRCVYVGLWNEFYGHQQPVTNNLFLW